MNEGKKLDNALTKTLNTLSFETNHLCVGEYKMNYENKVIIQNYFSFIILLTLISVSFNSIFRSFEIIKIPEYLVF